MNTTTDSKTASSAAAPIGLLAGSGAYPLRVAAMLRERGRRIAAVAIRGETEPSLESLCDEFTWGYPTRLGPVLRFFRHHGVTQATMAGKIRLERYFRRGLWLRYPPDSWLLRAAIPFFVTRRRDCRCDSILGTLCREFEREGVRFIPATDEIPELLVKAGLLTRREPTEAEWRDLHFGWHVARELGRLDIGQSVLVRNQTVVAIEAMEHTDQAILRAGELCPHGGFVLVKTAKPSQDMRFDVPVIGTGTLESMAAAGGGVIAVEADRTLLIELANGEFSTMADRLGLAVVALQK